MKRNPSNRMFEQLRPWLVACSLIAGLPLGAMAATFTWDASGGDPLDDGAGAWNATGGSNWFDGASTYGEWSNSLSDTAVFGVGSGAAGNVTVGTVNAGGITFNAAGSGNYTLSGGTVTLGGVATLTANADATIQSIIAGSNGLTKTGVGTLVLSGKNTYTGGTAVTAGTLVVDAGNYTKDGSGRTNLYAMSVASGTSLNLVNNGTAGSYAGGQCLVIQNLALSGSGTLITSGTGVTDFWGGSTNLSAFTGTFRATSGTMAFQTTLTSGVNAMILDTGAFLDLRTDGGITISSLTGTGKVGSSYSANMPLTVGALNASSQFDGVIQNTVPGYSNSPSIALTKIGTGTLTLTGANSYTGRTTVNGGKLEINGSLSASSALTLGGGTLSLTGSGTTQTLAGLTTTAGTGSGILLAANKTLTLGALTSAGANSALNFNTAVGGADADTSALGTSKVVLTGQTTGNVINKGFTVTDSTGFGLATVDGSNNVIRRTTTTLLPASGATSPNDYQINSTALTVTASQSAASITVDTTAGNGVLTLDSGVVQSNNTWNFGGVGSNTFQITGNTGGAGLSAVASNDTIVFNNYNAGTVTIASNILANGTNAVHFNGTGTTVLSGSNTYTGKTYLNGGVLLINADNNLGAAPGAAVADQLTFAGGTLRFGAATTLVANRGITLNAAGGTIDTIGFNSTINGVVAGAGSLTKTGSGILTLSGSNNITGGVFIEAGTLQVGVQNALTTSTSVTLAENSTNATLHFNAANTAIKSLAVGANATGATVLSGKWAPAVNGVTTLNSALTVKGVSTGAWNGVVFKDKITGDGAGAGNDTLIMDAGGQNGTSNAFVWQYDSASANDFVGNVRVTGGTTNAQALGGNYVKNNLMFTDSALLTIDTNSRFRWNNTSGYAVHETIDGLAGGGTLDRAGAGAASTLTIIADTAANDGDRIFSGSLLSFASLSLGSGTQEFKDTTVTSTTTVNINSGATLSLNRSVNGFSSRTTIGGNALVLNGGILSIDSASGFAGGWVTVNGATGSLSGAGTIHINSGVFARDNTSANTINTTATVNVASGAFFGAGRGGNSTIGALNGEGTVGAFWSGINAGSITIGNGGGSGSFDGQIRGNGNATDGSVDGGILSVIKTGSGTQTLSGAGKTYAGATIINGGTLKLTNPGTTFVSAITVNSGTTLELNTENTSWDAQMFDTSAGAITGTGTITKTGTGIFQYRNTTTMRDFAGTVDIQDGTFGSAYTTGTLGKDGSVMTVNVGSSGLFDLRTSGANAAKIDKLTGSGRVGTTHNAGSTSVLTVGTADGSSQFDGAIMGNGTSGTNNTVNPNAQAVSLVKVGAGTFILTGANTYSGATSLSGGTLLIHGSTAAASAFTTASGTTLGGSGSIGGSVNVSGVLAPGASIESLATGSLSMAGGSTFAMEIQDTTGTGADLLDITGDFSLSGLVNLQLSKIGDATWTIDDKLTLASYTGIWNGGFFTYDSTSLADGGTFTFDSQDWKIDYNDTLKGNNFASEATGSYVTLTVVPEPAAALLGGLGALLLLRRRR